MTEQKNVGDKIVVVEGWQPIESCPADTDVLVWDPYEKKMQVDRFVWKEAWFYEAEDPPKLQGTDRRILRTVEKREVWREWQLGFTPQCWHTLPPPP